jgi:hypothetical protein
MHHRLVALSGLAALAVGASVGCGGSSSETPPPLEPTPANVHYDRSATTLPGELGSTGPDSAAEQAKGGSPSAPPPSGRQGATPER